MSPPSQSLNTTALEASLWEAADNLRANSKLTSSEYCMPVLGVIFLRQATNRYDAACRQIAEDQADGKMAKRAPIEADFLKRRALMLPKEARYDELLKLPKGSNLGTALVEAMNAIERDFERPVSHRLALPGARQLRLELNVINLFNQKHFGPEGSLEKAIAVEEISSSCRSSLPSKSWRFSPN